MAVRARERLEDSNRRPLPTSKPMRSQETVTVACKHPSGLKLRVFRMVTRRVAGPAGFHEEDIAEPLPDSFDVKGPALPAGVEGGHIVGGYALTENCPKWLWDLYAEQNAESHLIQNNILMAFSDRNEAAQEAKKLRSVRSGMEPVDPNNPPKIGTRLKIETGPKPGEEE